MLHYMCKFGDDGSIDLIERVCKSENTHLDGISFKNEKGETALHVWSHFENSCMAIGETLIENGADINAIDKSGMTPAMQCACSGVQENKQAIIELLLRNGAETHHKDKYGHDLLYYCKRNKNWMDNVEFMIKHG